MVRSVIAARVRPLGDESGNALIESVLVLPAVLVIAFGIVATGRVVHAQIGVQTVAREAGRTLAAAPSASAGLADGRARASAVAHGHGLSTERLQVALEAGEFARGGTVRAQASYRVALEDLPLLGLIDVEVTSSHQERVERYRSRTAAAP